MCRELFEDDQAICIDHDHNCCKTEKASCGKCVRGLLCVSCNTALGIIERKIAMARAYLANCRGNAKTPGPVPLQNSATGLTCELTESLTRRGGTR
jgi:recombination endonuclease VII